MSSSLSVVGVLWAALTLSATTLTIVGYLMPYWLTGGMIQPVADAGGAVGQTSFGTYRRCGYLTSSLHEPPQHQSTSPVRYVSDCGHYETFGDIPSLWWQATVVLVGCGCCVAVFVTSLALFACCIGDVMTRCVCVSACLLQLAAGCCVSVGCVMYPLGWNNVEVMRACTTQARQYHGGSCEIGWAYWITVGGGTALVVCSWLACYAGKRKHDVSYQPPPLTSSSSAAAVERLARPVSL